MPTPLRTIIESPLGSREDGSRCSPDEFRRNQRYALRALKDSLSRGEAPFGSHLLYPLVLEDSTPEERRQGMEAGFAWGAVAEKCVVYCDHGITPGMAEGIKRHRANGLRVLFREIGPEPLETETEPTETALGGQANE